MPLAKSFQLPDWVPSEAHETWFRFFDLSKSFPEARHMLQRLATWPIMKEAWAELKYFEEVQPSMVVARAFSTWLSAIRGRSPLRGTIPNAGLSFRELANHARIVADGIRAINPDIRVENGITDASLSELDHIATFLEREDELFDIVFNAARFSRKKNARNAHQIAFVNRMCDLFMQRTGRRPYTLVAILANVAFDVPADTQLDADRVKHCYRSRSRKM
jgi:hypothetical protein